MTDNLNLDQYRQLKHNLERLKNERKSLRAQADAIQQNAIAMLLEHGVRFVDESGAGTGPYWVLTKEKSDAGMNRTRAMDFFTLLLDKFRTEPEFAANCNSQTCCELMQQYLQRFQKRRLTLTKQKTVRSGSVDDLLAWLNEGTA